MDQTAIDAAFRTSEAHPEDSALYLRLLERILDTDLFLLLADEPEADRVEPHIFEVEEGQFMCAFDTGERLAEFLDSPAPYIALAGRQLVEMIAGKDIGLALNLGVAPSEMLLPPDAVNWMAAAAEIEPEETEARIERIAMPRELPSSLIEAIDARLAGLAHHIREAHLVEVTFTDQTGALLLALVGVAPAMQGEIAAAIGEAVQFCGLEHARLDVTFLPEDAPMRARMASVSIRIDLPEHRDAPVDEPARPKPPGSDPDKPPILR